jgi:hypothetical protein
MESQRFRRVAASLNRWGVFSDPASIEALIQYPLSHYDAIARDHPKWIAENEGPFFTPDTVAEMRNWIKATMLEVPLPAGLACRRTIATADLRSDLARIVRPPSSSTVTCIPARLFR